MSPIKYGGVVVGASKIARDITEQRRLRKELEEAKRMKDEFLATLSHELRTPLNTVVGYAAMLQKGMMEEAQHSKAVDVIHRNAHVLTRLVGELLDTSRIVTGQIRLVVATQSVGAGARGRENIRPRGCDGVARRRDRAGVANRGDALSAPSGMWNLRPSGESSRTADEGQIDVDCRRAGRGAIRRSEYRIGRRRRARAFSRSGRRGRPIP